MRRNPKTPTPWPKGRLKTPGRMLFEIAAARPVDPDPQAVDQSLKLVVEAGRMIEAEARAGLWRDPPPRLRRQ